MSPVRPYVKAQKNDDRDAEAIAEAATRPTMRFVSLKSEGQLDMQTLHRARDRLVGDRTSLMNQLRAILLERGIVVPKGRTKLKVLITKSLGSHGDELSSRIRALLGDMLARWQTLDDQIAAFDAEFTAEARNDEATRRLTAVPGIGALNATALVAAVGDAGTFARGRDLAAWLGLVPRQATTGGKPRLLGITKRGSKYLRKMLIRPCSLAEPRQHASRSVATRSACASPFQHRRRRTRCQDGAHCLGTPPARTNIRLANNHCLITNWPASSISRSMLSAGG
jgi:transposase